jgi:DNA-binding NarL/FixJ family response regulator
MQRIGLKVCEDETGSLSQLVLPSVCVIDDDPSLHDFLGELGSLGHFRLIGSFVSASQALSDLPGLSPDLVVMDNRLPDLSGIDCTKKLTTLLPGLPIIILTGYPERQIFFRSIMAGARGFLVKPCLASEILAAIRDVLQGDFVFSKPALPYLVDMIRQFRRVDPQNPLTTREEEILGCLFEGQTDKEIASTLGIGTATVHTHMHRLFEKLCVHSRREIIFKYLKFQ